MTEFLRHLLALTKPYRWRLVLGVFFGVLAGLVEPLVIALVPLVGRAVFPGSAANNNGSGIFNNAPQMLRPLLNGALKIIHPLANWFSQYQEAHPVLAKLLIISLVPLIFFLRGLLGYLNVYFLQWVAIRSVNDLRTRLFAHLQRLSSGFFSESTTGDLMSRIMADTGALLNIIAGSLATAVKEPVTVMSCALVLILIQPKLTVIVALAFPVSIFPIVLFTRKARKAATGIQDSYSEMATVMHESFTGSRIVKAYNLEEKVIEKFRQASSRAIGHYMRIIRSQEIPGPLIEFIASIGVAGLFVYVAFQAGIDANRFIQFVLAVFLMYRPIKNIVRLHNQLEQARAASERVFKLLATTSTVPEPVHPKPLRAASAEIEFDRVGFSYGEKPALQNINLKISPGQLIALVGESGSGKTTLANLLLRFYDPQQGAIKIGSVDLRDVATRDLRQQMAVVTQENILFNDTVRRNIELGKPGATNEEIISAAKHANAHNFIMEKPNGYDTIIGEKGVMLSGGQRQRIAIARAVLRNAPILILDEATSALDTESERAVQSALDELMRGRTTICIAHRLSTILHADVIVVLDKGKIVETGRHEELAKRGGIYQKLYELQFRG